MITFNLLGCCVSRDVFTFDEDERYKVLNFLQGSSPISMLTSCKPPDLFTVEDIPNGSPWEKRCFLQELNSGFADEMRTWKSDWLLFDAIEIRYPMKQYDTKQGKYFITMSFIFDKNADIIKNPKLSNIQPTVLSIKKVDAKSIKKLAKKMATFLTSIMPEERIIINEAYIVSQYISKEKNLLPFENNYFVQANVNEEIKIFTDAIIKCLPKATVIKFPKHVLGDETNKWGLSPLHYTKEYYNYVLKAINLIVSDIKAKKIKKSLKKLLAVTSENYANTLNFYQTKLSSKKISK